MKKDVHIDVSVASFGMRYMDVTNQNRYYVQTNQQNGNMTKAEEAAMKAYPVRKDFYRNDGILRSEPLDLNQDKRYYFQQGYEQAEKDIGWRSVEDELPSTPEYVYTCIELSGIPQCVGLHVYRDGKWWEDFTEEYDGTIEYWMPIPNFKEDVTE